LYFRSAVVLREKRGLIVDDGGDTISSDCDCALVVLRERRGLIIDDGGGDVSSDCGSVLSVKFNDFALVRCACHPIEQRKHDRMIKRMKRDLNVLDDAVGILVVNDLSPIMLLLWAKKAIMNV
jgi:hypothetical protein